MRIQCKNCGRFNTFSSSHDLAICDNCGSQRKKILMNGINATEEQMKVFVVILGLLVAGVISIGLWATGHTFEDVKMWAKQNADAHKTEWQKDQQR